MIVPHSRLHSGLSGFAASQTVLLRPPYARPFFLLRQVRFIARIPGSNQQSLARFLRVLPSRMVVLIDQLAKRGLVERKRSTRDRRHSELVLTQKGKRALAKLSKLAIAHEADLCGALTPSERETFARLGRKIVAHQGLTPDVHPDYRKL